MSTFVVVDNILYADDTYLHIANPMRLSRGAKHHVTDDNQIAYCVSGRRVEETNKPRVDRGMRILVEYMVSHAVDVVFIKHIFENYNDLFGPVSKCLICTRENVYATADGSVDNKDPGHRIYNTAGYPNPIGSGSLLMSGILAAGISPLDAYPLVHESDPFTASVPNTLDLSTLDPFVVRGKPSKMDLQ